MRFEAEQMETNKFDSSDDEIKSSETDTKGGNQKLMNSDDNQHSASENPIEPNL